MGLIDAPHRILRTRLDNVGEQTKKIALVNELTTGILDTQSYFFAYLVGVEVTGSRCAYTSEISYQWRLLETSI